MYNAKENKIWLGMADQKPVYLLPRMANRHGLIAGASGTGKTVTLKVLAESFSDMGVPVFLSDIKGDVSGLCKPGEPSEKVQERIQAFGISDFNFQAYPVRFFDVFGKNGIPLRATISDLGPELLGRILQLNDTQNSVLQVIFTIADDQQLLLIDIKDLKAMLTHVQEKKRPVSVLLWKHCPTNRWCHPARINQSGIRRRRCLLWGTSFGFTGLVDH